MLQPVRQREEYAALPDPNQSFHDQFVALFDAHFCRIHRYMSRLARDPELAEDVAQEAFVRLYRRGSLPDRPEAWLISVALNLLRNEVSKRSRRHRLLAVATQESPGPGAPRSLVQEVAAESMRRRVRDALGRLSERDRRLLLLRAEGYAYHDLAHALGLHEASVGVMLARARRAFRQHYEGATDAP